MRKKIRFTDYWIYLAIIAVLIQSIQFENSGGIAPELTLAVNTKDDNTLNDSLPHFRYRMIADSLQRIKNCKKELSPDTEAWMFRTLPGVTRIDEENYCAGMDPNVPARQSKYFMALPGYRLQPGTDFCMNDGKHYLKIIEADSLNHTDKTTFSTKNIDVRFQKKLVADIAGTQPGYVFIPLTEKRFKTVRSFFFALHVILLLYFGWSVIFLSLKVLYSITRGKAFSEKNSKHLGIIGWSLIGFALAPLIPAFIFDQVYRNTIPGEIAFFFTDIAFESPGLLLAGLISLLLQRAFSKGYLIQTHNELAI
jgi:hypothetical protein